MDYFKKYDTSPAEDLKWNIPERKQGIMAVIGSIARVFALVLKLLNGLAHIR